MYFSRGIQYVLPWPRTDFCKSITPKPCIPKSWEGDHFPDSRLDSIVERRGMFQLCYLLPNDPNLGTNDRILHAL
jgi:hypothetical protein